MNVLSAVIGWARRVTGGEARRWREEMKRQHRASVYETRRLQGTGNFVEDKIFPQRAKRPVK